MRLYFEKYSDIKIPGYAIHEENVYIWQCRTLPMAEFNKKYGKEEGLWKSKGINHRDHNGKCYRQVLRAMNYIIVPSISKLCELISDVYYLSAGECPDDTSPEIYFLKALDWE